MEIVGHREWREDKAALGDGPAARALGGCKQGFQRWLLAMAISTGVTDILAAFPFLSPSKLCSGCVLTLGTGILESVI